MPEARGIVVLIEAKIITCPHCGKEFEKEIEIEGEAEIEFELQDYAQERDEC